ncbi:hypothetical protein BGZ73_005845 [Actinomortierella ambigua]|nr:hypothetical protein BGZ73_005845 [Actinomortierella ambigua]
MLLLQSNTEWATQYYQMNGALFGPGSKILAAQFSNIHRFFFITLAPLLSYVVYPFIERRGWEFPVRRRMIVGYFVIILAFTVSAMLYKYVEEAFLLTGRNTTKLADYDGTYCEGCVNGWAQVPQWFLFALGECLVTPSGLELVYTESSRQFRAISTSFWMLGSALGSAWINIFDMIMIRGGVGASERCLIFSGIGVLGAIFFSIIAWFHVPRKNRKSINQVAQEAKDAEFSQTCY